MNELPGLPDFIPHVGTLFSVPLEGGASYPLTLSQAAPLRATPFPGRRRESFSLLFLGPGPACLPQQMHLLRHSALGDHLICLVPIGMDGASYIYQAVFN